jgi:serine/threonine protein kinase
MIHGALNYRLVRKLSEGALAEVFLAQENGSEPPVLFQVLRSDISADNAVASRLLKEASAWAALQHPNVARQLNSGWTPEGRVYLVSEYLDGEDLASYLKTHGTLSGEELIQLMLPVCAALEYLHQRELVHGDIKPANILLHGGLRALRPKLMNFGWASLGERWPGATALRGGYLPPEYDGRATPDARWDIYGLGAVMYEALTGAPPFVGATISETLEQHASERPATIIGPNGYLSPVVERCLSPLPEDRFASAGDLAAELRHCRPKLTIPFGSDRADEVSLAQEPREKEGDVLGSYELVKLIGEGSMGRVFLARHARLGRQVALKIMRPEHLRNRHLIQRFFQEARSVNQINHEHIVEVFDFVEEVDTSGLGRVYCVMELLVGASLANLLRNGPVSISRAVKITQQVCAALEAAHHLGVVHRDVKPDNIFITRRNDEGEFAKVLDFGVAKLTPPLGEEKASGTLEGAIVGTPAYMAPEQAAGLGADYRADIYGVGVVLYEMLAGRPPFESTAFGQLVVQIITKAPPPLPSLTSGGERIPSELRALVMRCLDKEPQSRPQSMAELSQSLGRALVGSFFPWPIHLGRVWPVAAAALVLASLGALAVVRSARHARSEPPPALGSAPSAEAAQTQHAGAIPVQGEAPAADLANIAPVNGLDASVREPERSGKPSVGVGRESIPTKSAPRPVRRPKKKNISPDGIIDPFEP